MPTGPPPSRELWELPKPLVTEVKRECGLSDTTKRHETLLALGAQVWSPYPAEAPRGVITERLLPGPLTTQRADRSAQLPGGNRAARFHGKEPCRLCVGLVQTRAVGEGDRKCRGCSSPAALPWVCDSSLDGRGTKDQGRVPMTLSIKL